MAKSVCIARYVADEARPNSEPPQRSHTARLDRPPPGYAQISRAGGRQADQTSAATPPERSLLGDALVR